MLIPIRPLELILVLVVAVLLFGGRRLRPGPPRSPLPGEDSFVLNRKRRANDGTI